MAKLSDVLDTVSQRTSVSSGNLLTAEDRYKFALAVSHDIGEIINQLNQVNYTLFKSLPSDTGINALDYGLTGNAIYTDADATEDSSDVYYSSTLGRKNTIKESFDVIIADIAALEAAISGSGSSSGYDDTAIRALINTNSLDLEQLALDTMGDNYTLDGDGAANNTYSLSQAIDAIGAFFTGFPGTGNTYSTTYPTLSLSVLLSQITIDTTLAQSVIDGLPSDLGYIRDFIGMSTSGPESPSYSSYGGALNVVVDGENLEKAIWRLDQDAGVVDTLQQTYDAGAAGTAGDLQLSSTGDAVRIKNDPLVPLSSILEVQASDGSLVLKALDGGVFLDTDKPIEMAKSATAPAPSANTGKILTLADATSGETELHYISSSGTAPVAQITRDGIVKELEVGHETIYPPAFTVPTGASGPTFITVDYSSPDMSVQTLDFDSTVFESAFAVLPIPQDENGQRPMRLKLVGHFLLKPPGLYPGGTGIAFSIRLSRNSALQLSTVPTHYRINAGWKSPAVIASDNTLGSSSIDWVVVLEWPEFILEDNPLGILNIMLTREVGDPNDTWDNDVGLLALHATWYR